MAEKLLRLSAHGYQQCDADVTLEVPGEAYGGWQIVPVELPLERTALVSMHAWEFDGPDEVPGIYRAVEYITRADRIVKTVHPRVLGAAREAGMPVFHVVGGKDYFRDCPGHAEAVKLAGPAPEAPQGAPSDPAVARLRELKSKTLYPGEHNAKDIETAHAEVRFPPEARPLDSEPVSENAHQLNAVCRDRGVSHLIYIGFAINWCLLKSPGGMVDMSRLGYMCSTIREATTAVENKETARQEVCKQVALWRVALAFGFVFDADDFVRALKDLTDK